MTAVKYSEKVGKSRSLLSVYRKLRGLPLKTDPIVIHETYIKEMERQDNAICALQDLYYELKDTKNIRNFGLFLESKGLLTHKSFNVMLNKSFMSRERLIGLKSVEHYENIVRLYEEWK